MKSNETDKFEVKFWGTRGTLPVSGQPFSRTGGNTNCIEVICGDHTIIIDAGTGIRELGSKLVSSNQKQKVHLFLTHAHYDHVEGIPFFAPFFIEHSHIDISCGKLQGISNTSELISSLMKRPFFPVGPEVFAAKISYNTIEEHSTFNLSDEIKVTTAPLNHPGGSTGYRIDFKDSSFACITDTEHIADQHDENILKLIDNVDAFSYDCSLLDKEMCDFEGYGHSTFEEGMRLAELAKSKALYASHHMPFRNDNDLDQIEQEMKSKNLNYSVAREGHVIKL